MSPPRSVFCQYFLLTGLLALAIASDLTGNKMNRPFRESESDSYREDRSRDLSHFLWIHTSCSHCLGCHHSMHRSEPGHSSQLSSYQQLTMRNATSLVATPLGYLLRMCLSVIQECFRPSYALVDTTWQKPACL